MQRILLMFFLIPSFSYGMNTNSYFEIETILTWADYTNGTFKVGLRNQDQNANNHCPAGYWLDKGDSTNSNVLSVALSAFHSKTKVKIYANENEDWAGLSSKECKIQLIILK